MKSLLVKMFGWALGCMLLAAPAMAADRALMDWYNSGDPWGTIEEVLIGSHESHVYHHPWCRMANKDQPGNYDMFNTVQQAKMDGYRPCDVCRPPSRLGY